MQIELAEIYRDTDLGREAEALLLPCVQCGQCTLPVLPSGCSTTSGTDHAGESI